MKKIIILTLSITMHSMVVAAPMGEANVSEKNCKMDIEKSGMGTKILSVGIDYLSELFTNNNDCWLKDGQLKGNGDQSLNDLSVKYIF